MGSTYIRTEPNAQTCSVSTNSILHATECVSAAQVLGLEYKYSNSWANSPPGCYTYASGGYAGQVYFNEYQSGVSDGNQKQLLCSKGIKLHATPLLFQT